MGRIAQSKTSPAKLKLDEAATRILLARAKGKLLEARRKRQPVPAIDTTLYVGWNAMFVSAYLEAARVLMRDDCAEFALRLSIEFSPKPGTKTPASCIASADRASKVRSTIRCSWRGALLDAWEFTLDSSYYHRRAEHLMRKRSSVSAIPKPAASSIARKTPRRWAASTSAASRFRIRLRPAQIPWPQSFSIASTRYTGEKLYHDWAEKTLEAFAGLVPQYGLFAATYGLAALLHARHTLQVVITGAIGDPHAAALKRAANEIYRFGKSVLRVTPERIASVDSLPHALRDTLPHLDSTKPQALVCVETTCHPPVTDPAELKSLLTGVSAGAASASK